MGRASRAVVRAHAAEWHIDRGAVGIGSFSAGGQLALNMARLLRRPEPWTHDEIDALSRRPDFLMLIYPEVRNPSPGGTIGASFPPAFFALAADASHAPAGPTVAVFDSLRALLVQA